MEREDGREKMNFGFNFVQRANMSDNIRLCKEAEAAGFQLIGIPDSPLIARELYVSYTAYLMSTSRATFMPLISNPLTRHPSVVASAALSLNELSPGRVTLGLASGDSAIYGIGKTQAKVEDLRNYVLALKGLFNGEEVTWEGNTFTSHWQDCKLPVPVKIFVAAHGAKTMKMAAQVADGIIVGMGATAEVVNYCFSLVKEGAEQVGRNPAEVELWWHPTVHLGKSREEVLERMGGLGVWFLTRSSMEGKLIPEEYKEPLRKLDALHNVTTHAVPQEFGKLARELGVFDYLVERTGGLVGTPEDVVQGLHKLRSFGVSNVVLLATGATGGYPGGSEGSSIAEVLGKEVLHHFL